MLRREWTDGESERCALGVAGVRVDRWHSPLDVLIKYEACQVRGRQMLVETTDSNDLAQEFLFSSR